MFGDIIGGVFGGLFGDEPEPAQAQTGYGAWPEFAQQALKDYFDFGSPIVRSTAPFQNPGITEFDTSAMDMVRNMYLQPNAMQVQGAPALSGRGYGGFTAGESAGAFDFGKRGSRAYRTAEDIYGGVQPYIQSAYGMTQQGAAPITRAELTSSISDFYNPYEELVGSRIEEAVSRNTQLQQARARARAGGAFGNTGVNIEQGTIAGENTRTLADMLADLYRGGYETAMGMGYGRLTDDRSRMLSGGGQTLNIAGQQQLLGDAYSNLGSNYLNALGSISSIRKGNAMAGSDLTQRNITNALTIGDFLRGRETRDIEMPLRQLGAYRGLFAPVPTSGTSTGVYEGQAGALDSYGDIGRGIGNVVSPMLMRAWGWS